MFARPFPDDYFRQGRRLVYPYFYRDLSFSDEEIANYLRCISSPNSDEASAIVDAFESFAIENMDLKGPIEIKAWEGNINSKKISIFLSEPDDGASLLGKASLNHLWVKDGNIISKGRDTDLEDGIKTVSLSQTS